MATAPRSRRPLVAGRQRPAATLAVALLVLAGCSSGEADDTDAATPTATAAAEGTAAPPSAPATATSPTATPAAAATSSPTSGATEDATAGADLPGEDFDGPAPGARLAVVGVAADDVLNVRDVPGTGGEVFGELDPLADDVTVTGRARSVDGAIWYQVEGGAADDGWVNARYLAHLGDTTDITSELPEPPAADTLVDLAHTLAEQRLPIEAEGDGPEVVISDGPSVGDLGEVTIDIVGLPDDAVTGERLHLFAQPTHGGEGFALRTVERTLLCARGVSNGRCI